MASKPLRRPALRTGPRVGVTDQPAENTQLMTPVFCLAQMRSGHSVIDCDQEHRAAFAVALYEHSKMRWLDITLAPRHGLGIEKIARSSLRVAIPPEITPDVEFIALRFHGAAPMVGYRNGRTFHVLWLDPGFRVYRHS